MKPSRAVAMLLMTGLLAVACVASASAAPSMSTSPPCTPKALSAGLKRGKGQPKNVRFERSFGCAGAWAYSEVEIGTGMHRIDAVAVYHAEHGVWVAVNRAKPCRTHEIPAKIYRGACTTS
jgi:hypothetical protein